MKNNVAQIREKRGLTQAGLAQNAGVSRPYLSAIERGKQKTISSTVMLKIAGALNEPVSTIFFSNDVVCAQQGGREA